MTWYDCILKVSPTGFTKKLRNNAVKDASFQGIQSRPLEEWRCQYQDGEAKREQI